MLAAGAFWADAKFAVSSEKALCAPHLSPHVLSAHIHPYPRICSLIPNASCLVRDPCPATYHGRIAFPAALLLGPPPMLIPPPALPPLCCCLYPRTRTKQLRGHLPRPRGPSAAAAPGRRRGQAAGRGAARRAGGGEPGPGGGGAAGDAARRRRPHRGARD